MAARNSTGVEIPVWRCEYYYGYHGPKHTRELVYTCESLPLVSTLDRLRGSEY